MASFKDRMDLFKRKSEQIFETQKGPQRDKEILDIIDLMHMFANEKHELFGKIWTEFTVRHFACGVVVGLFLFVFHQSVAFGRSEHLQDSAGVTGMLVSFGIYIGAAWFEFYPVEGSAVVAMIIAFG